MSRRLTWNTTLDFSSRYVLMLAPMMWCFLSNPISMYFPKRLLLSFLVVLAFPIAYTQMKASVWEVSWKRSRSVWEFYRFALSYLHDGAGRQHFLLHAGLSRGAADRGEVTHGVFSRNRLPCTRFSAHDDGLILLVSYRRKRRDCIVIAINYEHFLDTLYCLNLLLLQKGVCTYLAICLKASSDTAKIWGSISPMFCPLYALMISDPYIERLSYGLMATRMIPIFILKQIND